MTNQTHAGQRKTQLHQEGGIYSVPGAPAFWRKSNWCCRNRKVHLVFSFQVRLELTAQRRRRDHHRLTDITHLLSCSGVTIPKPRRAIRVVSMRSFWRRVIVRKIIAITDILLIFFFVIFYQHNEI